MRKEEEEKKKKEKELLSEKKQVKTETKNEVDVALIKRLSEARTEQEILEMGREDERSLKYEHHMLS